MIEIVLLALAGSALAGIWDLKTTEVPDQLPVGMVVIGIGYWVMNWLINSDAYSLGVSLLIGTVLLAAGMLLYKKGQWGGADAWILAAIGYMIPLYGGEIFIVPYLFNFIIVSIVYTVAYAVIIGLLNPSVFAYVKKDFAKKSKIIISVPAAVFIAILVAATQMPNAAILLTRLLPLVILLMLFWRYAAVIEKRVFRKKIPTSMLKVGDVLEKSKWTGLTEADVKKIRKQKRFVVIKEGMRFVPVFPIALALTLLYGNLFFILL